MSRAIITKKEFVYQIATGEKARIIRELTDIKDCVDGLRVVVVTKAQLFKDIEVERTNEETGKLEKFNVRVEQPKTLEDLVENLFFSNEEVITLQEMLEPQLPKELNYIEKRNIMLNMALKLKAIQKKFYKITNSEDWEDYEKTENVETKIED